MKRSTSKLLSDHCDEFLYYEDLADERGAERSTRAQTIPKEKWEAYVLLFDAIRALRRENYDVLLSSRIKDTMKRKRPSFNEAAYGYRSFSELLEEAESAGYLVLNIDEASGTYVVTKLKSGAGRRPRSKKPGAG